MPYCAPPASSPNSYVRGSNQKSFPPSSTPLRSGRFRHVITPRFPPPAWMWMRLSSPHCGQFARPCTFSNFSPLPKPGEYDLAHVRLSVAVGVLEKIDIRRGDDVDAAVRADDAGGPRQIVGEDGARLVVAVAVLVLEHRDAAEVRRHIAHLRVVDHLDDEHAAALVEATRRSDCAPAARVPRASGGSRASPSKSRSRPSARPPDSAASPSPDPLPPHPSSRRRPWSRCSCFATHPPHQKLRTRKSLR